METISIIVPMYKVEDYVEKCLNSLLTQTYSDIKVFAISDGSPDNSYNIALSISKKDDRVIAIEKENGGYGSVLEYAIKMIDTKYFLICDPDDWLEPNAIETLYSTALINDADIVIGDKYKYYSNGDKKYVSVSPLYKIKPNVLYTDLSLFPFVDISPHSKMFKTEKAKGVSFVHKVSYTDTILYLITLLNSNKAVYVNKALSYHYIDRPGNSNEGIVKMTEKSFNQFIMVFDSIMNQLDMKKELSFAILYSVYIKLRRIKNRISSMEEVEKEKYYLEIKKMYNRIKPYKNGMYKYIKDSNILKKVYKRIRLLVEV